MGWVLLTLRKQELQQSVSDRQLKILQISNKLKKLESFSSAISDGSIDPNEISAMGTTLFGESLDYMTDSTDSVADMAAEQTTEYANIWEYTQNENSNTNMNVSFDDAKYIDSDGNLDTDSLYDSFVEEDLKEYVEEYYTPMINELEKELENEKTEQETLLSQEEQEMQSVGQSISSSIQSSTVQLS